MLNKISIGKYIERIVTPEVQALGFSKGKGGRGIWEYTRKVEPDEEQVIRITKSNFNENSLRVEFDTSSNSGLFATQLTFNSSLNPMEWETYEDERSLEELLHLFVRIIQNEGMEWLQIMSIPDLEPKELWIMQLNEEPSKKAEIFAEKHGLNYEKGCLLRLEELILVQKEKKQDIDGDFIVHSSAFFGEYIIKNLGGVWGWHEYHEQPTIQNINGKDYLTITPLRGVCRFWSKPTLESLSLVENFNFTKILAIN